MTEAQSQRAASATPRELREGSDLLAPGTVGVEIGGSAATLQAPAPPLANLAPPRTRFRQSLFLRADRFVEKLRRGLRFAHEGLWLGLLDADDFEAITDRHYAGWQEFLGEAHNRRGLQPWEEEVLGEHFRGCRRLLLGAAGGGRELLALAGRFGSLDGFDCSRPLVEVCRRRLGEVQPDARVWLAPPSRVPQEAPGDYDGLMVGWCGYVHIPGREARIRFLRELRGQAKPGAPLLLSFFVRPPASTYLSAVHRAASWLRKLRPGAVPIELGDTLRGSFSHHFVRGEIESEMAAARFRLEHYSERPYGHAVGIAE